MGLVVVDMSISLDGFAADQHGSNSPVYPDLETLGRSDVLRELIASTGAVMMGRRAYDLGDPDGFEDYEYDVPIFVLTHHPPERPAPGRSFTFVSDGIESALAQAKTVAGERHVTVIGGIETARQCLRAGLVGELRLRVVPVLLNDGTRLLDELGSEPIELEHVRTVESVGMTHLRFRIR